MDTARRRRTRSSTALNFAASLICTRLDGEEAWR